MGSEMCIRDSYPPQGRAASVRCTTKSIAKNSTTGSLPPAVPLAITPTFSTWTHTSDDSYIYQLSLVLATATVSFLEPYARTTRYEEAFLPLQKTASVVSLPRPCLTINNHICGFQVLEPGVLSTHRRHKHQIINEICPTNVSHVPRRLHFDFTSQEVECQLFNQSYRYRYGSGS